MQNLTLTTAGKLKAGDKFYREGDDSKQIFIVKELECSNKNMLYAAKEGLNWADTFHKSTAVIFVASKK